jgi:hypothetical protein
MAKKRTSMTDEVAAEVFYLHDGSCCVCGEKLARQIHHLDENPANHELDNLALLCLQHHHETQVKGGFSRTLSPKVVRKFRDEWISGVQQYRLQARELAARKLSGQTPGPGVPKSDEWYQPLPDGYAAFVRSLPDQLKAAYKAAQPLWDSGGSLMMIEGTNLVIDILKAAWIQLSKWYPPQHFGPSSADFIERYLNDRYAWHRALVDADNDPTAIGSSKPLFATSETLIDLEHMVEQTVRAVAYLLPDDFSLEEWDKRWNEARAS